MKTIAITFLMVFGLAACAQPVTPQSPVVAPKVEEKVEPPKVEPKKEQPKELNCVTRDKNGKCPPPPNSPRPTPKVS